MKLPRLKPGDAIEAIWIDSHFRADKGWMDAEEIMETQDVTIRSVCQYAAKDKEYLYTVADRSEGDPAGVMRDLKIPKGCIKSVRRLA